MSRRWPEKWERGMIKTLSLERWMKELFSSHRDESEHFVKKEIPPVFNRDGWYYVRYAIVNPCWFETNGRAFACDKEIFLYILQLHNHTPLTHKERTNLTNLLHFSGKSPIPRRKELNALLQLDCEWNNLRKIRYDYRL